MPIIKGGNRQGDPHRSEHFRQYYQLAADWLVKSTRAELVDMCTPTLFPKATDWTQAAHSLWSQGEGRGTLAPSPTLHASPASPLSLAHFSNPR